MNSPRRKLILGLAGFLGVMLSAATGVLAYAAYQMQTARFGNIFDRISSEWSLTWVVPTLIVIAGISVVGVLLFVGLFIFLEKESANV